MKKKEKELNESFVGLSPSPILTRIGINSGDMVVGNMGSERKMNYTVMGNEVNIASRLEAVNKMFGSWILISENTYNATGDKFLCRRLGRVKVSGISSAVVVYELLDFAENARSEQQTNIEQFNRALALFEKRDWTGAEKLFGEVIKNFSDDHPAHFYMQRCSLYALIPPSQDWDGVLDWNSK
ncbi:hypothetical protein FACS1894190_15310 [Spirochaetia bacterium]|nr:hypothetical protein FACS1894190_15310 [Spirochaetia bacterium]